MTADDGGLRHTRLLCCIRDCNMYSGQGGHEETES